MSLPRYLPEKIQCAICLKEINTYMIDKNIGAYFNSKKQLVCYNCMINEEK